MVKLVYRKFSYKFKDCGKKQKMKGKFVVTIRTDVKQATPVVVTQKQCLLQKSYQHAKGKESHKRSARGGSNNYVNQ